MSHAIYSYEGKIIGSYTGHKPHFMVKADKENNPRRQTKRIGGK